jgi:uncharacterized protein (TIGR03118 family)
MKFSASRTLLFAAISVSALCAGAWRAEASYVQVNLVSNIPGLATLTDSSLVNPWGVSYFDGSPFWVSDQGANVATLYAVTDSTNVSKVPLTVSIPTTASGPPQGPTGQVANTKSTFDVGNGGNGDPAKFVFDNLNGTISAWNTPGPAFVQVTTPGAVYTGLAINQTDTMLYAVNNATGAIQVYGPSFNPEPLGPGAFATPTDVGALRPFNAQDINGTVYVTYAPATVPGQIDAGLGQGAVVEFGENGKFIKTLIGPSGDLNAQLAAPWGVALAPTSFGKLGGDLLVGNFSTLHSEINAYNPTTGMWEGMIGINPGASNTAGGLWALTFGTMGSNGSPNTLYFTDGINTNPVTGVADGLFGAITSVPELSTWAMMLAGLSGLGLVALRRRRSPLAID